MGGTPVRMMDKLVPNSRWWACRCRTGREERLPLTTDGWRCSIILGTQAAATRSPACSSSLGLWQYLARPQGSTASPRGSLHWTPIGSEQDRAGAMRAGSAWVRHCTRASWTDSRGLTANGLLPLASPKHPFFVSLSSPHSRVRLAQWEWPVCPGL